MRITGTTAVLGMSGVLVLTGSGAAGAVADGVALTEPQARAIAIAGVVMKQDLPAGYFTPPRSSNEPDRKGEAAFYRCVGAKAPSYLARNVGGKFLWAEKVGSPAAKTLEVDSTADVTDSISAAMKDQSVRRTPKAIGCYREGLIKAMARNLRGAPKTITVDLVEASVAGADDTWAYRISFTVTAPDGKEVTGNGYVLGARVGQALLSVGYTGTGQEYTLAEVTAVAAKPVARADQAAPATKAAAAGPKG